MCEARQYCDEMVCYACSLRWDVNDDEPPECNPKVGQGVKVPGGERPTNSSLGKAAFAAARRLLASNASTSTTITTGAKNTVINTS